MGLFDQNQAPDLTAVTPEAALEELVGEGKKYATVAELAKAHLHASVHIGKLEEENGQYRTKVEKAATIEEILAKLQPQNGQQQQTQISTTNPAQQTTGAQPDLTKLVEEQFAALNKKQQEQANTEAFRQSLVNTFGTEAATKFAQAKAEWPGIDLESLAAANPKAALKLFGIADQQQPRTTAPDLSRNVTQVGGAVREGTDLYFYNLRKEGKLTREQYFSQRQAAILRDAELFYSQRAPKK